MDQAEEGVPPAASGPEADEDLTKFVDDGPAFTLELASEEREHGPFGELIGQTIASKTPSRDVQTLINSRIAQIDQLVSMQLNEVIHHPDVYKRQK